MIDASSGSSSRLATTLRKLAGILRIGAPRPMVVQTLGPNGALVCPSESATERQPPLPDDMARTPFPLSGAFTIEPPALYWDQSEVAWPAAASVRLAPFAEPAAATEAAMVSQARQLIKAALEARTPEAFAEFLEFTTTFRRLSIWNARMAQIQRPGARAIASEHEWRMVKRTVAPDAVPIIILWPFGPIRYVYEVADTLPLIDRASIGDPFATAGELKPAVMQQLTAALRKQKHFRVDVELRRLGHGLAGQVARQGTLFPEAEGQALPVTSTIGGFSRSNAEMTEQAAAGGVRAFRVLINDRLTIPQQFVTLAHELGHMFCGHLGACHGGRVGQEESGWPDRRALDHGEREIEAEAVAYIVANRAGVVTRAVDYLAAHAKAAKLDDLDVDLVVRAAARIERLSKIRYGRMDFGSEPPG